MGRPSKVQLSRLVYTGTSRKEWSTSWLSEEKAGDKLERWIREVESDGGEVYLAGRRVRGYMNRSLPFHPCRVRQRVHDYDDRSWGPIQITIPRRDRVRVGRGLLKAGYAGLAEDAVAEGVLDMTGEGAAMVALLEVLFSARSTRRMGEGIARAFGAMKP